VITQRQDEAVQALRDDMAGALEPVLAERELPAKDYVEAGRIVLWSMLTLAVDVALVLGVKLDDVQDFCNRAAEYAENAKPVRDAERMTRHLRQGQA
jgi:hypothetical protein